MSNAIKKTILGVVGPRVAESNRVDAIQELSPHFRLVDLEMSPDRLATLGAIDKIKVNTGAWNVRTYTPMLQPHAQGRLRLLIYLHGQGPGSTWATDLRTGDAVQTIGPKAALQPWHTPFVLVGDETSFGVACNFQTRADVMSIFEVADAHESEQVLRDLGVRNAVVVQKSAANAHREAVRALVQQHMQALQTAQVVLTGHAQAIQRVGKGLRAAGLQPEMRTKPHWADHKEGLD